MIRCAAAAMGGPVVVLLLNVKYFSLKTLRVIFSGINHTFHVEEKID